MFLEPSEKCDCGEVRGKFFEKKLHFILGVKIQFDQCKCVKKYKYTSLKWSNSPRKRKRVYRLMAEYEFDFFVWRNIYKNAAAYLVYCEPACTIIFSFSARTEKTKGLSLVGDRRP